MKEQAKGTLDEMLLSQDFWYVLCPTYMGDKSAVLLSVWLLSKQIPGPWSFESVPGESIKPGDTAFA